MWSEISQKRRKNNNRFIHNLRLHLSDCVIIHCYHIFFIAFFIEIIFFLSLRKSHAHRSMFCPIYQSHILIVDTQKNRCLISRLHKFFLLRFKWVYRECFFIVCFARAFISIDPLSPIKRTRDYIILYVNQAIENGRSKTQQNLLTMNRSRLPTENVSFWWLIFHYFTRRTGFCQNYYTCFRNPKEEWERNNLSGRIWRGDQKLWVSLQRQ